MSDDPLAGLDEVYAAHVHPGKVATFKALGVELVLGEREGPRFQDARTGRWYVNCHCNGGVFNLGHRNPEVIAAVRAAMDHLDIGNHHLLSPHRAAAAVKLAATTGGMLPGVVFAASGGEAVEVAIKAARGFTRRRRIITVGGAYHGHTGLTIAAGDHATQERYLLEHPDFTQVPFDDLAAIEQQVDERTAAVLIEAIPATAGFPIPSPGYLAGIAAACRDAGALLIVDEVQTGLGRTGTWWYVQQEGVVPDAIITGKGLSGGIYPIAAALLSREVFDWFTQDFGSHVSTFGGAELGCVAAATVLDIVARPGFLDHVNALAARFSEAFADAPFGVRQRGLTMGLQTGVEGGAFDAWAKLFDAGVFAFPAAHDTSIVQFKPPLILTLDEADDVAARVRGALG